jgi:hypothetical protein
VKRSVVAVAFLLAGCGSSASNSYRYVPAAAKIPSCAHAGKAIALPSAFPHQFPFPAGTDIDATHPLFTHQIGIYGFVPSHTFAETVNFFKNQVPKQGFKLVDFEVDSPNDSEGTYQGHGKLGRWQLRSMPSCKGAMIFSVSSEPSK